MKAIKRTVAALLATLMLATSTSFTLAAEEYTDAQAVVVAKVNAAGIMTGTDKGFEPSKSLTRAEAAAIIVRMKGISESATKAMAGTTLFTDVPATHWASGYVNQASNLAIVKGVSATEFAPDREVTIAEFVTMAVRALGAGQLVDSEGTWPTNYVNFANDNDILKDVTAVYTATATRLNAATIVANTLEAPIWEKSGVKSNGEISWTKSAEYINADKTVTPAKTILNSVLNIAQYNEALVYVDKIEKELTATTVDYDDTVTPVKGTLYLDEADVANSVDLGNVKTGVIYDIWYDKDTKEVVGVWESEDAKQKLVKFTEITKDAKDGSIKIKVDGAEKEYDFAAKVDVYYNGELVDTEVTTLAAKTKSLKDISTYDFKENVFGSIKVVSGDIAAVYLEEYTNVGIVDEIANNKVKFDTLTDYGMDDADTLKINDEDYLYNIDMNTLKSGDVVFYYKEGTKNVYHVLVSTNTVEGKVTAHGEDYIKIDGNKYKLVGGLDIANGKEVVAYLNAAGKIVAYDLVEDNNSAYAVIKTIEAVNGRKGVDFEVTLAYFDGTTAEFTLDLEETADEYDYEDKAAVAGTSRAYTKEEAVRMLVSGLNTKAEDKNDMTVKEANDSIEDGNGILGTVVDYEIKSSKLVLSPVDADDTDNGTGTLEISKKSNIDGFYFNKSTKFMIVKADADKDYNVKVEIVDVDSLKTSTAVGYSVAGLNDNYVDYVVLSDNVKRVTVDGLYGIFLNKETNYDDDEFYYAYTVLFADGAKTLYSDTNYTSKLGEIAEFTLDGDEITEIDQTVAAANKEGFGTIVKTTYPMFFVDTDDNGLLVYSEVDSETTTEKDIYAGRSFATLGDDVMYVMLDGTKFKEGNESDIVELRINKNNEDPYTIDDEQELKTIYTRVTDKGIAEVIAVIYVKK